MNSLILVLVCGAIAGIVIALAYRGTGVKEKPSSNKPKISGVKRMGGAIETRVKIVGEMFGHDQGLGVTRIGGKVAEIDDWSDESITAMIPFNPVERKVTVLTEHGASNEFEFDPGDYTGQSPEDGSKESVLIGRQ